jgi:hypothetical protein
MKLINRLLTAAAIAAIGAVVVAGAYAEGHRVPGQP